MSASYAAKIYKRYGKDSIARVQENPYRLADDVWGIGFKTADSVAFNMGYQKNDLYRCQSGILYALNQLATEGHVYAEEEQLMKASLTLLETEAPYIRQALQALAKSDEVIIDEGAVYLPYYYHAEVESVANCRPCCFLRPENCLPIPRRPLNRMRKKALSTTRCSSRPLPKPSVRR